MWNGGKTATSWGGCDQWLVCLKDDPRANTWEIFPRFRCLGLCLSPPSGRRTTGGCASSHGFVLTANRDNRMEGSISNRNQPPPPQTIANGNAWQVNKNAPQIKKCDVMHTGMRVGHNLTWFKSNCYVLDFGCNCHVHSQLLGCATPSTKLKHPSIQRQCEENRAIDLHFGLDQERGGMCKIKRR